MHGNDDHRHHRYDYDGPTDECPAHDGAGQAGHGQTEYGNAAHANAAHGHAALGQAGPAGEAPAAAPRSADASPDADWIAAHDARSEADTREREIAAARPRELPGFHGQKRPRLRPGGPMPEFPDRRRSPAAGPDGLPAYDTRERPVVGPDGALPAFTDRDRYRSQPSPAEPPEQEHGPSRQRPAPTTGERVAAQVRAMLRRRPGSPR